MEENKTPFQKFWKRNGINMIVALVITLVVCYILGGRVTFFSLPVWMVIGVVCWVIHSGWLYYKWRRANEE